jgi:hypothetical protein
MPQSLPRRVRTSPFTFRSSSSLAVVAFVGLAAALAHCSSAPPSAGEGASGDQAAGPSANANATPTSASVCETACNNADSKSLNDPAWATCYSCKCKEALGALPTADEIKCSSGAEVKVYRAVPREGGGYDQVEVTDGNAKDCANPALLVNQCLPGSRLGQFEKGGAIFKVICRRKAFHTGEDLATDRHYEDIGIVGYNPQNGATCFWDDSDVPNGGRDGDALADLDLTSGDPAKLAAYTSVFYNTDGENCVTCHDNDPFMFSPFVRSVWKTSRRWSKGPYQRVHVDGVRPVAHKMLTSPAVRACTQCHRITDGETCNTWALDSLGEHSRAAPYQTEARTESDETFPLPFWMPPDLADSLDDYHAQFDRAKATIKKCCKAGSAASTPGCTWENIPLTPATEADMETPPPADAPQPAPMRTYGGAGSPNAPEAGHEAR